MSPESMEVLNGLVILVGVSAVVLFVLMTNDDAEATELSSPDGMIDNAAVIFVRGTIGVGKTTAMRACAADECAHVHFFEEDVDEWRRNLQRSYDGEKWGTYDLQVQIAHSMRARFAKARLIAASDPDVFHVFVMERSPDDARDIFAPLTVDAGLMTATEAEIALREMPRSEDVFYDRADLMVHAPLETCIERVRKRSRDSEASVTDEYLSSVHVATMDAITAESDHPVYLVDSSVAEEALRQLIAHRAAQWA